MPLAAEEIAEQRRQAAKRVLELLDERGEEVSLAQLARDGQFSARRLEQLFESEDDLFDAVAGLWFEPKIAVMEEVLGSDLPPNRKMYEFFARRFVIQRDQFRSDPTGFALICELGAARFERVRSYVDLADHYLCEIIAQAQAEGFFAGLEIDQALSLINQMVANYTLPDALIYLGDKVTEEKLAMIIDTIFIGLSGEDGGSRGVNTLRIANKQI
jgi:AcrR family transcriptional regulator